MKNVQDLIDTLSHLERTRRVYLSSDAEGNSYASWSGDISPADDYWGEPIFYDLDDEPLSPEQGNAVVLWP